MNKIYMCFPYGKHKVLTLSYDDAKVYDRRLIDILNKYSIKGTFHINGGMFGRSERIPKDEVMSLYNGHEISGHSYNHPTIARSPKEAIVMQVIEDRKELEKVTKAPVRGFSYPNGFYNELLKDMLPMLGIEYARTVKDSLSFEMPTNFHEWHPTCHHNNNLMSIANKFKSMKKTQNLYMMYVWGHSFDFERDNNWEIIEEFASYISNDDSIWYATNIEIVDYINSFNNLKFSADCTCVYNPSFKSVWISVVLNDLESKTIELKGGQVTNII